jgi:Undecaprenyl-phosphate galactose phosphotransferase WbaP
MSKVDYQADSKLVTMPVEKEKPILLVGFKQSLLQTISIASLVAVDTAGLLLALALGYYLRINVFPVWFPIFPLALPPELTDKVYWILGINVLCLAYAGLYTKRLPFWRETKRLLMALSLAFALILAAISLAKLGGEVSRTVLVVTYILALFIIPVCRYLGKTLLAKLGVWNDPLIIVGINKTSRIVSEALINDQYLGYRVAGFISDNSQRKKGSIKINGYNYPVLGRFKDAANILNATGIRRVVIAAPELPGPELVSLTNQLQPYTRSILVVPDLFGIPVVSGEMDYFFDEQIIGFRTHNNLASGFNRGVKRMFDIVVGTILLVLLLPILLIIAIMIKLDSPGPVGFSHKRVGKDGYEFNCYKFRSMVVNAQEILEEVLQDDSDLRKEWECAFKLKNDPRVTRVGEILRKTSLDELPQIFNVIKGEMSLVGPRPITQDEVQKFGTYASDYFMVLPGITGLWGVSGRSNIDYDERVRLEAWYVRNWSLWLDISLLFRTLSVVLGRKGAY